MDDRMLLRVAGATLVLAVVAGVTTLRRRWAGRRWWTLGVAITLISVPLWVPVEPSSARAVAAALVIAVAMKTLQLQSGLVPQPALERGSHFLLWLLLPPRTLAATTTDAKAEVRRQGLRRWARAVPKAALLLALIVLCARISWPWPFSVWAGAFEIYFILSGLADLLTGVTCVCGFATAEVFDAPFVARSPSDFWGRRWNLFVSGFLRRHIFAPLSRAGYRYAGATASFFVSGLAHEYFVLVSVDPGDYEPGYMMLFFTLQALAVMVAAWWRAHLRRARFAPAAVKVVAHWLWLAATAPLFIWPLRSVLAAVEASIRGWLPV